MAEARTWSGSDRLVGDGPDVILVFPATASARDATAIHDGPIRIWAYAGTGRQSLLAEAGGSSDDLVIPKRTSLLEIDADAAWAIASRAP